MVFLVAIVLSLLILATLMVPAGRPFLSIRCSTCGRPTRAVTEQPLSRLPLVVEITYQCACCGGSTVRYEVAPDDE